MLKWGTERSPGKREIDFMRGLEAGQVGNRRDQVGESRGRKYWKKKNN